MIYQPANVYPNNNTVDASIDNNFSWLFNGDNLSSYRVDIYKLNESTTSYTNTVTPTTTVYGGDTVTYTLPANSVTNAQDYIWKITLFETNPTMFVVTGKFVTITSETEFIISTQMSTVQTDMYLYYNNEYKKITEYKSDDGTCKIESAFTTAPAAGDSYSVYTPFTTTLNGFYFKTRKLPVVTIDEVAGDARDSEGNLNQRQYTFTGHYTQEQNTSIKYHSWSLYNASTNALIDETDDVYNSNIKYTFDGFATGVSYKVVLNIETQDGVGVTESLTFNVLYSSPEVIDSPLVQIDETHNAAKINYNIVKISIPDATGTYDIDDNNTIHIRAGELVYSKISGRPININDYTIVTQFKVEAGKNGKIIGLSTTSGSYNALALFPMYTGDTPIGRWFVRALRDDANEDVKLRSLKDDVQPVLQDTNEIDPNIEYLWYDDASWDFTKYFIIGDSTSDSGLFKLVMTPTDIYLQDENGNLIHKTTRNPALVYNNLVLSSQCYFDFVTLLQRSMTESEITEYLNQDTNFRPEFDTWSGIIINATFDNQSTTSSNLHTATGELQGYTIYRRAVGEDRLHNIGYADLTSDYIEDFMIANNKSYVWSIVPVFEKKLGISVDTKTMYVRFDDWCVNPMTLTSGTSSYSCDTTWKFGLNVEATDLTQNILKTKFEGLSQYPKFSVQKRNYISGGLTAYLTTMQKNIIYNTDDVINMYPEYSPFRNNEYIYNEPAYLLEEWNELVASGLEVLIRDIKGHMWRAQINENSGKIENYGQIMPTTVTWTFTEVGSLDNVSVTYQGSEG